MQTANLATRGRALVEVPLALELFAADAMRFIPAEFCQVDAPSYKRRSRAISRMPVPTAIVSTSDTSPSISKSGTPRFYASTPCVEFTTGSVLLMSSRVIHKPFINVPWTTPPIRTKTGEV